MLEYEEADDMPDGAGVKPEAMLEGVLFAVKAGCFERSTGADVSGAIQTDEERAKDGCSQSNVCRG